MTEWISYKKAAALRGQEGATMSDDFTIKDSGARQQFEGGMVRDTEDGKVDYLNVIQGPMLDRWAAHTTKGRVKYPDVAIGVPNWKLAAGEEELLRARSSAFRHMLQWLRGDTDEDHAAAVFFNVNLAEYVEGRLALQERVGKIMGEEPGCCGAGECTCPAGPEKSSYEDFPEYPRGRFS